MGGWIPVGSTGELQEETMKEVEAQGRKFLLARAGGKYYAADSRCPHLGGQLSRGKLEGTIVTCPLHGSQFDLIDGSVVRWLKGYGLVSKIGRALKSPRPLAVYQVKVEDGKILVEV